MAKDAAAETAKRQKEEQERRDRELASRLQMVSVRAPVMAE